MNAELKQIFGTSITVGNKTIPTAHLRYTGNENTYVIWTITDETPRLCGDDEAIFSVVTVDIDIYSDSNYNSTITKIKQLMKANGWIWTEDSTEMYEEDTKLFHKCISFEKERNL